MSKEENTDHGEQEMLDAAREETGGAPEVIFGSQNQDADNPSNVEGDKGSNPFKEYGFESAEEFKSFVSQSKSYKEQLDSIKSEFDAFKAGTQVAGGQKREPSPDEQRYFQYPYKGHTAEEYADEKVQEEINQYAVKFFQDPRSQIIDLVADDIEAYVNTRIEEAFKTRERQTKVQTKASFLKENEAAVKALRQKYPRATDEQLLDILEAVLPQKPKDDPEAARDADARGHNTETGHGPRSGRKPASFTTSDDEEHNKFMSQLSRLIG